VAADDAMNDPPNEHVARDDAGDRAPRMIRHLTAADARRVAWKNGRGVTEELALWPAGAALQRGDFDWRISCAAVDEAGPFSGFPGFDRVLVVTSGAGLRLQHGTRTPIVRVRPLVPHRFSGDWPTTATLLGGPVNDFNVLTRRGIVQAELTVLRPGPRSLHVRELPDSGHTYMHVLCGAVVVRLTGTVPEAWAGDAGQRTLAARESLWIGPAQCVGAVPPPLQLEVGGSKDEGVVLLVRLGAPLPGG